jgi:hypothetical protein
VPRARLARALSACNVALTITALIGAAVTFVAGARPDATNPVLDVGLAVVLWSYLLGSPLLSAIALIAGDRRTRLIRASYMLLAVWLLVVLWTSTMTMRALPDT